MEIFNRPLALSSEIAPKLTLLSTTTKTNKLLLKVSIKFFVIYQVTSRTDGATKSPFYEYVAKQRQKKTDGTKLAVATFSYTPDNYNFGIIA